MKYSKIIVAAVIALNVAFAATVLWIITLGYEEPSALVVGWFAFTGTELLACAGIKVSEVKHSVDLDAEDSNEQAED